MEFGKVLTDISERSAISERDMGSQKCCLSHKRCPGLAAECDDLERGVGSGVPHRPDALPAEGIHPLRGEGKPRLPFGTAVVPDR